MEIYREIIQGSPEWFSARAGIPTSSRFSDVMAKGAGKVRRKYMLTLIGERITGEPHVGYFNAAMQRGHEMEAEARAMYELQTDNEVEQVGFIRNGAVGCSPDGLVGDSGMVEIKTKEPHLQLECLLAGKVPPEHMAQLQGQLWVAERQWCDFVSFWPGLPLFVKRVELDEEYTKNLRAEVFRFRQEMDELERKVRAM